MQHIFFDGWPDIWRTLAIAPLAYIVLVFVLRISGKRTLAKMNAFDLVVTVALGSTLATILLSKDVALAESGLAFILLAALQFAVTWLSVRFERFRRLVRSEPTLLVHRGQFLHEAMRSQRVTEGEVRTAMRDAGVNDLRQVQSIVLESDGSFSVVQ